MSVIKAGTTLTTAYTVEADTTGALEFKTGPSATLAMSISSSGVVTFPATTGFDIASANITNLTSRSLTVSAATYLATASGSVGIGTSSPSAWTRKAVQIGDSAQGYFVSNTRNGVATNMFYDGNNKYIESRYALLYSQDGPAGEHIWYTAASGVAGNTISFSQAMTLDASNSLGLGITPSAWGSSANYKAIQLGGSLYSFFSGNFTTYVYANAYWNGTNNKYVNNGTAASFGVNASGNYQFNVAASGTVGNNITFTEAMTVTNAGNVGIGTTSPTARLDVAVSSTMGTYGPGTVNLKLRNTNTSETNSGSVEFVGYSGNLTSPYQWALISAEKQTAAGDTLYGGKLHFWTTSSGANGEANSGSYKRLTINANGNVALQGGSADASGVGITFPATQVASSNANCLDDYEEGTWTPSVGGNSTYSTQKGFYTKIGRSVTAMFDIVLGSVGTGSTSQIGGLPFTSAPSGSPQGIVAPVSYWAGLSVSVYWLAFRLDESSTTMLNQYTTGAQTAATVNGGIIQDGTRIIGTITYFV